jgi:hypothetical protein
VPVNPRGPICGTSASPESGASAMSRRRRAELQNAAASESIIWPAAADFHSAPSDNVWAAPVEGGKISQHWGFLLCRVEPGSNSRLR